MKAFDVAVVGQGYAGLRAALLACEQGMRVATFEGVMAGGAVMTVLRLNPSPEAFTRSGPDLGALISMQNMDRGAYVSFEPVVGLRPNATGGWRIDAPDGGVLARHVVLATGTRRRALNVPGESRFAGNGVSHCADCDGPRVVGRDCVVVGGGDAAFQEAAVLAEHARSVSVLMRGGEPRARADLVADALAHPLVKLLKHCRIDEIIGNDEAGVTAIRYSSADGASHEHACAGVFILAGGDPDTQLLPGDVRRNEHGGVITDASGYVGIPGMWAIGSVRAGFRGGLIEAGHDAQRAVSAMIGADKHAFDATRVIA
ncbi:NAD(P)/FAD-dependent oxidoreductase [Caballeronia sp. ATUFL_M1_KS5A]|uniref:NAD(P)/FAD-dependent oxidoreductase n=1 Tax=Caballeronia sp. ATUFL_M1_KS5A TaxID=2921778 RepID=UPI0020282876|nr:NAD(P)/FAD-dependent oxidoreductase [Caballeronia sp. ATUFL_M1_KS5A]